MSLECLAILGIKNEPIYLCTPGAKDSDDATTGSDQQDVFGFLETDTNSSGLTIRQEFMIHAALDRLEEILGSPKFFDIVKMQRGTKWMGSLLPMEDCEIYGYVTPSNVKILALIQRESVIPLTKRKDGPIKNLCAMVHDAFVRYTMNPFTTIRGKVQTPCHSFEQQIKEAVDTYNESLLEIGRPAM